MSKKHDEIVEDGFGLSVLLIFLAVMASVVWLVVESRPPIIIGILGLVSGIPVSLLCAYIVASVTCGPVGYLFYVLRLFVYGLYRAGSWMNKKRVENKRDALASRREELRQRIAQMVADGPINHRHVRVDPSYLDDAEHLQSLVEQEDDPNIRGLMQEYCQLSKKLQAS